MWEGIEILFKKLDVCILQVTEVEENENSDPLKSEQEEDVSKQCARLIETLSVTTTTEFKI